MGIFDFLNRGNSHQETNSKDYQRSFKKMIHELQTTYVDTLTAIQFSEEYQLFTTMDEKQKQDFISIAVDELQLLVGKDGRAVNDLDHGIKAISSILNEVSLSDDLILKTAKVFGACRRQRIFYDAATLNPLLSKIESSIRHHGMKSKIKDALKSLVFEHEHIYSHDVKLNGRIDFLLQGNPDQQFNSHDRWGKSVKEYFSTLTLTEQSHWIKLFALSKKEGSKGAPTKKWLKEAATIVEDIGADSFATKLNDWLSQLKVVLQEIHKEKGYRYDFLRDENHDILKGLIWCAGLVNQSSLNNVLDEYAVWAYKKKPGVGPISGKTRTACMYAFSTMPIQDGVPHLSKFKTKVKNNTILKSINRFLNDVAKNNGVSQDEIQEMTVPDYGIQEGKFSKQFGNSTAIYDLNDASLLWDTNGKKTKSIPAEVKGSFASDIKIFKNSIKEIESMLPLLKERIEKSYLNKRQWDFKTWRTRFIDHPLTSRIAKRLIWHFSNSSQKGQGFLLEENLVDASGQLLSWVDDTCVVQLWHPIGFTAEEVMGWRNFIQEHKITQPFKQAYREVYILTDAELNTEVYSNRFAAHVLRQHQFAALCKQRGWQYHLMGNWDSHNTPTVNLPLWKLCAQFYVDADHNYTENDMGIFNFISTDQVRFADEDRQPIALKDVPALVFTEIMRDVDLFVGVTSIGNDPTWQDGGNDNAFMNNYWQTYSFGDLSESAQVRGQVLQNLIPRMKIAHQCSFDKKFLVVKGKVRTYKIHMGSGNILMEPNDQYLCIVAGRSNESKNKVFLPFEGDNLLSIIISKALLLADDDKIKDTTILSQINRK